MSEKVVFKGAREDLASKYDKQQELATILCETLQVRRTRNGQPAGLRDSFS